MNQGGQQRGIKVEFERPPYHVTARGGLGVNPGDILRSRAGQEIILEMARSAREKAASNPSRG